MRLFKSDFNCWIFDSTVDICYSIFVFFFGCGSSTNAISKVRYSASSKSIFVRSDELTSILEATILLWASRSKLAEKSRLGMVNLDFLEDDLPFLKVAIEDDPVSEQSHVPQ